MGADWRSGSDATNPVMGTSSGSGDRFLPLSSTVLTSRLQWMIQEVLWV